MRIEIKTKTPIKDNDIKALYLIRKALEISGPHMKKVNLDFAWESYNAKLGKKTVGTNHLNQLFQ